MEEIKTISIDNADYPKFLRKIKNAPLKLYYRGNLPRENEICFAVVGTRRYSDYGKQITLEIVGDLAEAKLTIVSGLAPGIDTFAHQATIERNGKTIAVLGTGVNGKSIYPQSNLKLAEKILEANGCLISEYPPGTSGSKFTFPRRNKIISGLSLGVLVIEAKEKSGALITADWAKRQQRKIFAVPGSVYSSNSKGPHILIKKGAKLAESAGDILNELNLNLSICETDKSTERNNGENEEEKLIFEILKEEALYVDKIIEKTKLPTAKVASALAILEIKGKVRNLGNNVYAISHR